MANFDVFEDNDCGKWRVTREGAEDPIDLAKTRRDAERIAKRLAANTGGGEVRVHSPDGKVRNREKVKPAGDPFTTGEQQQ